MNNCLSRCVGLVFLCLTFAAPSLAQESALKYRLSMDNPNTHYFNVEMEIANNKAPKIDIYMPVWTPGSYLVREYAKNVQEFQALDGSGHELAFDKVNKNNWEITANGAATIRVRYCVYSYEVSVRNNYLDDSHGFVVPASTFMMPRGMEKQTIQLDVKPYQGWSKVSTGLDKTAGKENSFTAPNYDILIDSPIEIGNQSIYEFEVDGKPHYLSVYGGTGNQKPEQIVADLKKIVTVARTCSESSLTRITRFC